MKFQEIYSGPLGIGYGQFYIDYLDEDKGTPLLDEAMENQTNGLCGEVDHGELVFIAGIQVGIIHLEVHMYDIEPALDESFQDIVDVSTQFSKPPILCEWAHDDTHELKIPNGTYRIRYCINGLDIDPDCYDEDDQPFKHQKYLIQIWPSPLAPDQIIKNETETGLYWHNASKE